MDRACPGNNGRRLVRRHPAQRRRPPRADSRQPGIAVPDHRHGRAPGAVAGAGDSHGFHLGVAGVVRPPPRRRGDPQRAADRTFPFDPKQSLRHYAFHGVYAATQVPLFWCASLVLRRRQRGLLATPADDLPYLAPSASHLEVRSCVPRQAHGQIPPNGCLRHSYRPCAGPPRRVQCCRG